MKKVTNKHLFYLNVCFVEPTSEYRSEESKNSTGYKFMTCENDMDRDSNKKHFIYFFPCILACFRGVFYARIGVVLGDSRLFLSTKNVI